MVPDVLGDDFRRLFIGGNKRLKQLCRGLIRSHRGTDGKKHEKCRDGRFVSLEKCAHITFNIGQDLQNANMLGLNPEEFS